MAPPSSNILRSRFRNRAIGAGNMCVRAFSGERRYMRSIIIIPTYNEYENLRPLVAAVLDSDSTLDILVVDDSSPDGTGLLAETLAQESDRVRVLRRAGKQGLGTAYVAGFRYALTRDYERIVEMDADFSHRPADLPCLLHASVDADVVIGSRNVPGGRVESWSVLRNTISKGGSLYARAVLGLPIKDCTSGFKCFRREALVSLDLDHIASNGFGFQVELNYLCHRAGLRIIEVPIVFPDRVAGRSKMSLRIGLEAAALVWRLRLRHARQNAVGASRREASTIPIVYPPSTSAIAVTRAR
jgi:dolichol-phosphate mannosyltransferase